jgi:hypothetical protein
LARCGRHIRELQLDVVDGRGWGSAEADEAPFLTSETSLLLRHDAARLRRLVTELGRAPFYLGAELLMLAEKDEPLGFRLEHLELPVDGR